MTVPLAYCSAKLSADALGAAEEKSLLPRKAGWVTAMGNRGSAVIVDD